MQILSYQFVRTLNEVGQGNLDPKGWFNFLWMRHIEVILRCVRITPPCYKCYLLGGCEQFLNILADVICRMGMAKSE